jgi:hypothetical protein
MAWLVESSTPASAVYLGAIHAHALNMEAAVLLIQLSHLAIVAISWANQNV